MLMMFDKILHCGVHVVIPRVGNQLPTIHDMHVPN